MKKVNISGPRRRWVDKDSPATHEECWLDTPIDVDEDDGDDLTATWPESENEASKPRSRSPRSRKPKSDPPKDEDGSLLESAPGWFIKDAGGTGDCGFRAIAAGLAANQNKTRTPEQLIREASTLRLRLYTVSHLTKHTDDKDGGAEAWAPDPQDTSLEWGGEEPPNTYAEYLKKCARRDAWIDGYMLRALSARLGIP